MKTSYKGCHPEIVGTNTVSVGDMDKRKVSKLNNEIYLEGVKYLEDGALNNKSGSWSIGWFGFANFIDWLEENYTITKK